jgi:hypothetical protein
LACVVVVVVAVVEVLVPVAVVVVVCAGGVDVETLPLSSPGFVMRNVTARTSTPKAAMIAGRGRSIRVAVGTVWVERS